jgi:hypothetical protein
VAIPDTIHENSTSSPWNVVSSWGASVTTAIAPQIRLVMIDAVSAKLRIIHRRWSAKRRRRAIRQPVHVQPSQSTASSRLLARLTGPNGVNAPTTSAVTPAGSTPPKT